MVQFGYMKKTNINTLCVALNKAMIVSRKQSFLLKAVTNDNVQSDIVIFCWNRIKIILFIHLSN